MAYVDTYEAVYNLHKRFGRVPPAGRHEGYWQQLIQEARALGKDPFTQALLVAVFNELERQSFKKEAVQEG